MREKRAPEEKKRVNLFNFTINYNNPTSTGTALFNGNISQTSWNTLSADKSAKMYNYRYDALSRITSAIDNTTDKRYSLTNVSYDKMGNITALSRNGHRNVEASNFGVMDDLTYSYDNGNKLMRISDAATIDQFGFKDDVVGSSPDTTNDYTYDVNGNMLTDTNKGITSNILYNHLSLPTQINVKGQVINYTYDAAGNKLKKVTNGVTTEYAGNYRYVGGELKDFKHPEGYVKNDGGTFNYVYSYTDHLGNVRLNYADLNNDGVIQAATEILDEKNYYPFGGTHGGYNTAINGAYYPFGYNGKEENDENGLATLDFGARNYDKWAGRWMNLDPLAEQMRRHSPYNYAFNNPIFFIDPDGMKPCPTGDCDDVVFKGEETVVGENTYNELDEIVVNAADGVYTSSSKKSFFKEGGMGYGLKAEARGVVKQGELTVDGGINVESLKLGAEGDVVNYRGQGKAEATALNASASGTVKYKSVKASSEAKGTLWSANASYDIGPVTNKNGNPVGIVTELEAGAYAAKGSFDGSISLGGYKIGFSYGGSVGSAHIGGKAKGYYDNSTGDFELSGMYHAGLGAGVKVGFEISKAKQKTYSKKSKK